MIERKKMYEETILNIMKMDFIANIYKQIKEKAKNGEFSLTVKFNDFADEKGNSINTNKIVFKR